MGLSVDATGAYVDYVFVLSAIEMTAEAAMRCYWVAVAWRPDTLLGIVHHETVRRLEGSVAVAQRRW
jgi:hypothetical protein